MNVVYTKHAKKKFKILERIGVKVTSKDVFSTIEDPDHYDSESDEPSIIVSRSIDKNHILRVVFKAEDGIITVITFYPARKGRYYGKKNKN